MKLSSFFQFFKPEHFYRLSIAVIFIAALYSFIQSPIMAIDFDLWYHLDGGRYIVENNRLPSESYFSFIAPSRPYTDYYWLFQVLVYQIYSISGDYGLIILRTLALLATMVFVALYLQKAQRNGLASFSSALLFAMILCVLIGRTLNVRPHIFSYLFIVVFIYILEFHPKKVFYLPFLSLLWANLHGIEYPVMALILGAYIADRLATRFFTKTRLTKDDLFYCGLSGLSMGATFLTPFGFDMIQAPFISTLYASEYISEISRLAIDNFYFYITLKSGVGSYLFFFNVMVVLTALAAIQALFCKKIALSHAIMTVAGIVLLFKAIRFINEFSLLAFPLIAAHVALGDKGSRKTVAAAASILLVALTFSYFNHFFHYNLTYPLSFDRLPRGNVAFLKHVQTSGNLFNAPNAGGYYRWALYPKYKIFMDMEVPFIFTDQDMYVASTAFYQEPILKKTLANYSVAYIVNKLTNKGFVGMIKNFPNYALVFFDDTDAVYVNKNRFPQVAEAYQLKRLNPYEMDSMSWSKLEKKDIPLFAEELTRMNSVFSDSYIVNQGLSELNLLADNQGAAIVYANNMIQNFPQKAKGYEIKGRAFFHQKDYDSALIYYHKALALESEEKEQKALYRKIFECYQGLNNTRQAYDYFKRSMGGVYDKQAPYLDLYTLGDLALALKRYDEARLLLTFAQLRCPESDGENKKNIEAKLLALENKVKTANKGR
jgi:tetratricopeptide (TPR) repeat protein